MLVTRYWNKFIPCHDKWELLALLIPFPRESPYLSVSLVCVTFRLAVFSLFLFLSSTSSPLHLFSPTLHLFTSSPLSSTLHSSPLFLFTSSRLHLFFSSTLHLVTSSPRQLFTSSPFHLFTSSNLHLFPFSTLHFHLFSSSHLN